MNNSDFYKLYSESDEIFKNLNTIMKVVIHDIFGEKIESLYSIIDDNEKFTLLLNTLGGISLNVPTVEEFKSSITLALVFYYKEVMHYDWGKIEELIPYENDISLRYGAKLKRISKTLKKKISNYVKSEDENLFNL